MSARAKILEKDRLLTRFEWFRKTKETLKLRCADYGLPTTGKKADLIDRVFAYLHPSTEEDVRHSQDSSSASSSESEDEHVRSQPAPKRSRRQHQPPSAPSLAAHQTLPHAQEIRNLIREELASAQLMAPTAITTAPTPSPHLQEVMPSNQQYSGMQSIYSNIPHQSTLGSLSLLPPISEKLLSDIKNQLYVDLNSLLPNALFDPAEGMYLQVHQNSEGANTFSLTPRQAQKRKINNPSSWMEAWNIYIRVMAHFHPELASELLAYQDFICTLQRTYPTQCWLRYDTAFRMNITLDKSLSWNKLNEYAFNKYVRCQSTSTGKCYLCSSDNHFANACPNRPFRPKRDTRPPTSNANPCRFYNNATCSNRTCKFLHTCSSCNGNHPAYKCTNFNKPF